MAELVIQKQQNIYIADHRDEHDPVSDAIRCSNCNVYNSKGTVFCNTCHVQLKTEILAEDQQQRILDAHVNRANQNMGLELVIRTARGDPRGTH